MSGTELDIPETMRVEDAPADDAPPPGERQRTPREIQMEAIAARAHERMEAELAQSVIYDQDARDAGLVYPTDEVDPEPVSVAAQPVAPVKQTPHEPAPAPAQPVLRAVNLDGQQHYVTEDQYAQLAQLGMVANVALHQYQPPPAPYVAPAAPLPVADPDLIRETVKQIQYGGEEAGAEALTRLVQTVAARIPQPQQIDQQAIVSQAVRQAREAAQLEADRQVIQNEYSDIFANPLRTLAAKASVEAIRARNVATGARQTDLDVYREAGNMVREAMGLSRPGNQDASPALQAASHVQPRQDVIERKRAAPRITQAIDLRAPTPQQPRPPTGSEIVDRMRAQRGQASMR